MRVVRPIEFHDLPALVDLADSLGPGMTTLPADRQVLAEKIERSLATFDDRLDREDALYLLVLEDLDSGKLLGTSALYPSVGGRFGFFSYKRLRLVQQSQSVGHSCDVSLLMPANDYTGATEVGTLAVCPLAKGSGAGRLLARARYLLAACFPERFSELLMAEMRGWQDADGRSPFWDAVGERFFSMDFATADRLSATRGNDFISELLPKHPIYVDLLAETARSAIGRPHAASAPAMAMLLEEGFRFEGFVDVFDAGPQVHARLDTIATVRSSKEKRLVAASAPKKEQKSGLVCTTDLRGFRVVATEFVCDDETIDVPDAARRALAAQSGVTLRRVAGGKVIPS